MATEKWISGTGQGLTWGTAINAADVNSLANGSSVLSSVSLPNFNGNSLDVFADISISLGSVTTVAPNYLGIYLFPLNQDGTTFGDGQYTAGTQSTAVPSPSYWVGNIVVPVGTQVLVGNVTRIVLPPGTVKFLIYNQAGVALAASSNTIQYRTYNRSVA